MSRQTDLLRDAAEALDIGNDPLHGSFLAEHDVASDEAMALARQMAIGARVVAHAFEQPRSTMGLAVFELLARGF